MTHTPPPPSASAIPLRDRFWKFPGVVERLAYRSVPASLVGGARRLLRAACLLALGVLVATGAQAFPRAYIANYGNNTVSVYETSTNALVATIPITLGTGAYGVSVNPAGTRVYVTNIQPAAGLGVSGLSAIDTATNTVVATVAIPRTNPGAPSAWAVAVNTSGTEIYVTDWYGDSLNIINAASNTITASFIVGGNPDGVVFHPDGTRAYLSTVLGGIQVINTTTHAVTSIDGVDYYGIAINPAGTRVYATTLTGVTIVDTSTDTVAGFIPLVNISGPITINPAGTRLYVATSAGVAVFNLATNALVATVAGPALVAGLSVDPTGANLFVTNTAANTVSVISTTTNTVSSTIAGLSDPRSFGNFIANPAIVPPPGGGGGAQPIPTLSELALYMLGALLALAAARHLRRQGATP